MTLAVYQGFTSCKIAPTRVRTMRRQTNGVRVMHVSTILYRLADIRDGHLVLRAPSGALRVVSAKGLQPGRATPDGVCFNTPQAQYTVPPEDYLRIKTLLPWAG